MLLTSYMEFIINSVCCHSSLCGHSNHRNGREEDDTEVVFTVSLLTYKAFHQQRSERSVKRNKISFTVKDTNNCQVTSQESLLYQSSDIANHFLCFNLQPALFSYVIRSYQVYSGKQQPMMYRLLGLGVARGCQGSGAPCCYQFKIHSTDVASDDCSLSGST